MERLIGLAGDGGHEVVYKVAFHAVDDLEFAAALLDLEPRVHGIRKRLRDAVVGDGEGLLPPFIGAVDKLACGGHAVHGGHVRMQVQLYALFFGGIDDLHHFRAENGVRAHNVFAVVFIVLHGARHEQRRTLFDVINLFAVVRLLNKLQRDGICVIGNVDGINFAGAVTRFAGFDVEHLAPNGDTSGFDGRFGNRHRLLFRQLAENGARGLQNDLRHERFALAHADAALRGYLFHGGFVTVHFFDGGGARTLFFLDVQSLDDGFVAVLQFCFARERHRNGHAEPLLHRFADGAVGMALFEQIESAVQQLYCKGIFVYGAVCVFKCAVQACVKLAHALQNGGNAAFLPRLSGECGGKLHAHIGQNALVQHTVYLAQVAVRHEGFKLRFQAHQTVFPVYLYFFDLTGSDAVFRRIAGAFQQIA